MSLNCRVKILVDDPLGRFQAGECGDMLSNPYPESYRYFIILEGKARMDTTPNSELVEGARRYFFQTGEIEILWGIPPSYIEDKSVRVEADSVEDYLDKHYKFNRFRDRGEEYTQALIKSYQEQYDLNGWVSTSRHDSIHGEGIYWTLGPKKSSGD